MSGAVVAFDTETHRIQPGILAPPLVIASYDDGERRALLDAVQARFVFRELLKSDAVIAGANLPYDIGVMLADAERRGEDWQGLLDLIMAKYERDEVHDILVAQALDAIAGGHLFKDPRTGGELRNPETNKSVFRYSLSVCCDLVLGRKDAKVNDFWRERYAILEHVPISEWPADARQYPIDDATNTRDVAVRQRGLPGGMRVRQHEWDGSGRCKFCGLDIPFTDDMPPCPYERVVELPPFRNIEGLGREMRADLALHLGALHGLRVDGSWLNELALKVDEQHKEHLREFSDFFKHGHKPGCLKRLAAAGMSPEAGALLGARVTEKGDKIGSTPHCVSGCTDGKEDQPLIRRLVATSYGAGGTCPSCGGTGRRLGSKGNEVGCSYQYIQDGLPCCDGTGLALDWQAPVASGGGMLSSNVPNLPRTEGGGVKKDRDTLIESGDERLMAFGDDEFEKVRETYVPFLAQGVDSPLCLSPNILVSSFRTSYNGPIQQMPREGEARACFTARPGFYYASCDYSGIELCTLAQSCLWTVGYSRMAEIINETGDPGGLHAAFGAQMLGCDPKEFKARVKAGDKAAKDFRQAAKAANFGFPGGMGAAKLVLAKRKKNEGSTTAPNGKKYGGIRFCILLGGAEQCGYERVTEWKGRPTPPVCKACCVQAEILRSRWLETFPEMPRYFEYINRLVEQVGEVRLPFPGCVRGGVGFTDGANGHFQELAALLGKTALWHVTRECYLDRGSSLYHTTRIPFFVHDELFLETRIDVAHLTAPRVGLIMERAGLEIVPDVKVKCEPAISRRWLKAMEAAYDKDGRLIPWEDSSAGQKYLKEKGWTL